ncbi:MAG: hypothetical protein AAGU73_11080, partial [Actinomycetota bacterium]
MNGRKKKAGVPFAQAGEPVDAGGHLLKDERPGAVAIPGAADIPASRKTRTLAGDAWLRLRKNKLAIAGLVWLVFIAVMTISADLWVPEFFADPTSTEFEGLEPPSAAHPFGTDRIGRDVFSRVVYGARPSLSVGVLAM